MAGRVCFWVLNPEPYLRTNTILADEAGGRLQRQEKVYAAGLTSSPASMSSSRNLRQHKSHRLEESVQS